ncbi:hypothetical protein MRX96_049670 [Rhipicephalus microplus]
MPPIDRTRGAYILPVRSAGQMRPLAAGCRGACTNALWPASACGGIWPCKIVRPKLAPRMLSGSAKGELAKPLGDGIK